MIHPTYNVYNIYVRIIFNKPYDWKLAMSWSKQIIVRNEKGKANLGAYYKPVNVLDLYSSCVFKDCHPQQEAGEEKRETTHFGLTKE